MVNGMMTLGQHHIQLVSAVQRLTIELEVTLSLWVPKRTMLDFRFPRDFMLKTSPNCPL